MTPATLIELGVELELRDDNLVVRGASDELIPRIRQYKSRLIAELAGRVCGRCFQFWRHPGRPVGDCLLHQFETHPEHDCGAWRPWSGHSHLRGGDHE